MDDFQKESLRRMKVSFAWFLGGVLAVFIGQADYPTVKHLAFIIALVCLGGFSYSGFNPSYLVKLMRRAWGFGKKE